MAPSSLLALFSFVIFSSTVTDCKIRPATGENPTIRVLTFNIWNSGKHIENGMAKIAKHILHVDPDIVAIQEVESKEHLDNITRLLGPEWRGFYHHIGYPDTGIASRHHIYEDTVTQSDVAIGGKINIPLNHRGTNRMRYDASDQSINVSLWSIHTDPMSYGPYAACNKLVTDVSQITAGELELGKAYSGRVQNALDLLSNEAFKEAVRMSPTEPLILAGDFNSPSHLDWTDETNDSHCDWTFEWPTTKLLMRQTGLKDAFRQLHPDPKTDPGITWSTVQKFTDSGWGWTVPEPQDRIDMVLYLSGRLQPVYCQPYQGDELVSLKPNEWKNDYPSDHLAVIADFEIISAPAVPEAVDDDDDDE